MSHDPHAARDPILREAEAWLKQVHPASTIGHARGLIADLVALLKAPPSSGPPTEAFCAKCGGADVRVDKEQEHPGVGICAKCGSTFIDDRPKPTRTVVMEEQVVNGERKFVDTASQPVSPPAVSPWEEVDTYTPLLWATLSDDAKYEEYVRVRQGAAAVDRARALSQQAHEQAVIAAYERGVCVGQEVWQTHLERQLTEARAEIQRLRDDRDAVRTAVERLRPLSEQHYCDEESDRCHFGSGPYCDTHEFNSKDDIEAARALLALAAEGETP